jgi:hypothetical protein
MKFAERYEMEEDCSQYEDYLIEEYAKSQHIDPPPRIKKKPFKGFGDKRIKRPKTRLHKEQVRPWLTRLSKEALKQSSLEEVRVLNKQRFSTTSLNVEEDQVQVSD